MDSPDRAGTGSWWAGLAAAAVVALADTVQRWRVHSPTAAWRKGARGEQATARRLRSLEPIAGYTVLHDRPAAALEGEYR
ncbi:hypothetical protein [Nonomuraea insulae]|uniref:Uncharacterized protein n=1 Tax=Nonomuraea insulae TaxID=1616787 RepID=A0ABW1DDI7_9ACTN